MLQRAASNAYSWWWASHIRTGQSKWLEHSLKDMEDKVKYILSIISEDADSFSQRAEMYYRKRPELINFVEESYRAYRALAERYDHISGELHNANNTIANVLPDQVHFKIEEEEEEETPERKVLTAAAATKIPKNVPDISKMSFKLPKVIKKADVPTKQAETNKSTDSSLSKEKATEEIDKIQKNILVLQTEKEFLKSSYESALAKFWEIEKQINEKQKEVYNLQDEYGVGAIIEDDEARALMAASALKSCEDTLVQLQKRQKRSAEAAKIECERIINAEIKLKLFKGGTPLPGVSTDDNLRDAGVTDVLSKDMEDVGNILKAGKMELESVCQKLKQSFEMKSDDSSSITLLAETIDELVNKVLTLETSVSSQTALVERLKTETDELQRHVENLEVEKATIVDDSNCLTGKIEAMEEELRGIQDLSLSIKSQNCQIRTDFNEACRNLDDLSEKLHCPSRIDAIESKCSPQEDEACRNLDDLSEKLHCPSRIDAIESKCSPQEDEVNEVTGLLNDKLLDQNTEVTGQQEQLLNKFSPNATVNCSQTTILAAEEKAETTSDVSTPAEKDHIHDKETLVEEYPQRIQNEKELEENVPSNSSVKLVDNPAAEPQVFEMVDDSLWQKLLLNGLDNREKILLTEYTSILRNYKETKKRLSEVEKKNQESMFQTMAQVRELKSSNAMKDLEIRSLRQKFGLLSTAVDENSNIQMTDMRRSYSSRVGSKLRLSKSVVSDFFRDTGNKLNMSVQHEQLVEKLDKVKEDPHVEEEIKAVLVNEEENTSVTVEEKFRGDIDELLEVNLEFWLRFSNSFHQIQEFHASIQEIKTDISKTKKLKKPASGSGHSSQPSPKSEAARIDKNIKKLESQLSDWLDQSALHREELQCRLLSLSRMQDEIAKALEMDSNTDQTEFTTHQAAKFQGEILNMQQENNTVHEELQAGVDYARGLNAEIEKIRSKLNGKLHESNSRGSQNNQLNHLQSVKHTASKTRIPLRSFLFGNKPKKSEQSIFACVHP